MRKTILVAMSLVSVLALNAQSRTNEIMLEFTSKSQKLTSSKGWEKNSKTGKWIENNNVIGDRKVPSYWISHTSQNFNWLQFSKINLNGKDYYVFLYERKSGSYKYPSIREGWREENRTYFAALTVDQYNRIKKEVDLRSGKTVKITSKMTGYMTDRFKILKGEHLYNEENLLAKITKIIKEPSYSTMCLLFNSQITDGSDIVRFRLLENCYNVEKNIDTGYFEVKESEFKTLFIE